MEDYKDNISRVVRFAQSLPDQDVELIVSGLISERIKLNSDVLTIRTRLGIREQHAIELAKLCEQWKKISTSQTELASTLLSAHLAIKQSRIAHPLAQLVWTGPKELAEVNTRTNLNVLLELIESAQREVVIVGYSITRFAEIVFVSLGKVRERGVRVVLIANDMEQYLSVISEYWPPKCPLPELYTRPLSDEDEMSALHAKLAIADQETMLVTSANLTYHGLAGNIEIGVLIKGNVANQTTRLLNLLIAQNYLNPINN